MNKLRTYRLLPNGSDSRLWKLSTYSGEVYVRAVNAFEARTLAATAFRITALADNAGPSIESPWYIANLVSCQQSDDPRFAAMHAPGVVFPSRETVDREPWRQPENAVDTIIVDTSSTMPASAMLIASDVRQAIVRLLLAGPHHISGRWLDVSVAGTGPDGNRYLIIPARKARRIIAEELTRLIGRSFDENQDSWEIFDDEAARLARNAGAQIAVREPA